MIEIGEKTIILKEGICQISIPAKDVTIKGKSLQQIRARYKKIKEEKLRLAEIEGKIQQERWALEAEMEKIDFQIRKFIMEGTE